MSRRTNTPSPAAARAMSIASGVGKSAGSGDMGGSGQPREDTERQAHTSRPRPGRVCLPSLHILSARANQEARIVKGPPCEPCRPTVYPLHFARHDARSGATQTMVRLGRVTGGRVAAGGEGGTGLAGAPPASPGPLVDEGTVLPIRREGLSWTKRPARRGPEISWGRGWGTLDADIV